MSSFNVVRLDDSASDLAFLDYPELGKEPFPALKHSWRLDQATSRISYRDYKESLNPPILHRTELLLKDGDPIKDACIALTRQCEQAGLFDNPVVIGFQRQWLDLIRARGFELQGFELRPLGNAVPLLDDVEDDAIESTAIAIRRHLTALSRSTLSAPVQSLIRNGLLTTEKSLFDYGCGKGDDVATLIGSGFSASGWDPYYRPEASRQPADVVNLGFVINVIEDIEERVVALQSAYELTCGVLAVAAMLRNDQLAVGQRFRDGVRTGRHTFQKYFTQTELQQFIEGVLDEDAYPAGPGIFYVFRDRDAEQSYLLTRTSDRSRVARARLATINFVRSSRRELTQKKPSTETQTPEMLSFFDKLWSACLELGRVPEPEELPNSTEAIRLFGTVKRAVRAMRDRTDSLILERAANDRRDDILVMLALHFFERRRKFSNLELRLQRDIKVFFGSYQMAEALAQKLLFSVGDVEAIQTSCEKAAALGLGWLDEDHSLQLHTSLVERLPAILRVYVGCAATLAGDLKTYDLVKVHIKSGKVTLMSFDDFAGKPLPAITLRIKVRLRDQAFDVFTYGDSFEPTVLYKKARYINEEFPRYAEQLRFDEALERLGLVDSSNHGLPESEFYRILREARYEIAGFEIVRSQEVPNLDQKCGSNFKYRDLIECGETWERTTPENVPRSPDTYTALCDLARVILDPVIEYFGAIKLTYAFAGRQLTNEIRAGIDPKLDQHASCELNARGNLVCMRKGAAVDFIVEDEDMAEVVDWIAANLPFDRIYFYGNSRPVHVSYGPDDSSQIVDILTAENGRRIPKVRRLQGRKA